ncbi:MAG: hypothetical protein H6687_02380 [Bacillales bacterium]|nr:hypothetical protein [Bacillales bacterium]
MEKEYSFIINNNAIIKFMRKRINFDPKALYSIALVVIGFLVCIFRSDSLTILITISGASLSVIGIFNLVYKNYISGIIQIVFGVLIVIGGWVITKIAILAVGCLMFIYGISHLIRKEKAISSILLLLTGALFILSFFGLNASWSFINYIFLCAGAIMVLDGAIELING